MGYDVENPQATDIVCDPIRTLAGLGAGLYYYVTIFSISYSNELTKNDTKYLYHCMHFVCGTTDRGQRRRK